MLGNIWLTDNCNLKCRYCYETKKRSKFMDTKTANDSVDYLIRHAKKYSFDKLHINYHGGEPLINFELMRYLTRRFKKACHKNNLQFGFMFTTNGTIFNDDIEKFLEFERPCVTISIDGAEETHDSQRKFKNGKGSFDKAIKTSISLQSLGILLFVRMTFNSKTTHKLSENIEFLINQGFKIIKPVPDYFDSDWSSNDLNTFSQELVKIVELEKKYDAAVTLIAPYRTNRKKNPCRGGITEVNVYSDGAIYPCTFVVGIERFIIGEVRTGINYEKLENEHMRSSKIDRSECSGCNFYDYCDSGRCTYANYRMTGSLEKPSGLFCLMQHALLKAAQLNTIKASEPFVLKYS